MSTASFYTWRAKYSGMDASMVVQTKTLEGENRRLKKMFSGTQHAEQVAELRR